MSCLLFVLLRARKRRWYKSCYFSGSDDVEHTTFLPYESVELQDVRAGVKLSSYQSPESERNRPIEVERFGRWLLHGAA